VHGVVPPQVQDPALALVEHHQVPDKESLHWLLKMTDMLQISRHFRNKLHLTTVLAAKQMDTSINENKSNWKKINQLSMS